MGSRPCDRPSSRSTSRCARRLTGSPCTPPREQEGSTPPGERTLLRYVLRPPLAQERVESRPGRRRPAAQARLRGRDAGGRDGPLVAALPARDQCTTASLPHGEVRGRASSGKPLALANRAQPSDPAHAIEATEPSRAPKRAIGNYRPWAELLQRTFGEDVLECPKCKGRMKLLAMVTDPSELARYLAHVGEPTLAPARAPSRGPPYWKSTVLRRQALDEVA